MSDLCRVFVYLKGALNTYRNTHTHNTRPGAPLSSLLRQLAIYPFSSPRVKSFYTKCKNPLWSFFQF